MKSLIHTPTPNLKKSLEFYTKLKFEVLSKENPCIVSDGKAFIEINPEKSARAGIKLYQKSWDPEVKKLKELGPVMEQEGGYILTDRSGVRIYLVEGNPVSQWTPKESSTSSLGNFAGVSVECMDIAHAAEIYTILGFSLSMGDPKQGWAVYQNEDGFGLSLLKAGACPHMFFNPSISYFNGGKNLPVIQKIRDAGIEIAEEITVFNKEGIVDNVILREPGGYGFFIFND